MYVCNIGYNIYMYIFILIITSTITNSPIAILFYCNYISYMCIMCILCMVYIV